jgi:hypothetical protein
MHAKRLQGLPEAAVVPVDILAEAAVVPVDIPVEAAVVPDVIQVAHSEVCAV